MDPLNGADYDQYYYNAVVGFDFKDHYNLELSYGFNNRKFDSVFFFFGSPYTTERDTDRTELKAKFTARRDIAGNKNVLVAGADSYASKVDDESGTTKTDVEKRETGYYVEDEYSLSPDLTLLAGYRRTSAKFEKTEVGAFSSGSAEKTIKRNSSKLGLTYNHVPGGKVFVSYSNGFRLPTTDEIFGYDMSVFPFTVKTTLLEPEKGHNLRGGNIPPSLERHERLAHPLYNEGRGRALLQSLYLRKRKHIQR